MKFYPVAVVSSALAVLLAGCGDAGPAAVKPVDDGAADMARARTALAAGDMRAAATSFEAAAGKCATNLDARIQLAVARLALGDIPAAKAASAAALELRPESAEAKMVDGQVAYLEKDYKRALGDFDAVVAEKTLPAAMRSSALVSRAVVGIATGAFDDARISLLRAMRLDRRSAAAWYHLGVLSRNTYHIEEAALEQFEMAARFSDPRDARTKKISREILPALRQSIVAAAAARPGVAARRPADAAKLLAEGESALKKKAVKAAVRKFEQAFAADPLSYEAALRYAETLEKHDKTSAGVDKALAAYRSAIDQRPEKQSVYLAAGRLAYANKRWATAAQIMDRAVAHDPENRQSIDLLVAALQRAGKNRQASAWKAYRNEL